MIVVALVGKWIASWLTQKIYKMAPIERELMFGLSNAQAAATLAAVLVGYNIILSNGERLLNEDVLNGTVLLILVTCGELLYYGKGRTQDCHVRGASGRGAYG